MSSKKKVVVNKKFLNGLADKIYNPKTRSYTRLCNGTLTNSNGMHCGLGELYFAMTGREPHEDGAFEDDVVQEAIDRSTLQNGVVQQDVKKKLVGLPEEVVVAATDAAEDALADLEFQFRSALDEIPTENDSCGEACNVKTFQTRAKRVAAKLREAAAFLPA